MIGYKCLIPLSLLHQALEYLFLSMMAFRKCNPINEHSSFVKGTTFINENETKLIKVLKSF